MPTVTLNVILKEVRVFAGDELFVKILLDSVDSGAIVNEFFVEILGIGRTGWINIHTDKIYESEKEYLKICIPLMTSGQRLPMGRHLFPLHLMIPEDLPSSYESEYGNIRYAIKVSLRSNSENSTCTETFPFIVVARSFFDEVPETIMKTIEFKDEVDFTCCSFPFGTVFLKIVLSRRVFCIGENVNCLLIVRNRTRKILKNCCLLVMLKIQCEALSRYEKINEKKLSEEIIDSISYDNIKSHSELQLNNMLKIPETSPPSWPFYRKAYEASLISLNYVIKFVAAPGIDLEAPLIITARGFRNQTVPSE